MEKSKYKAIRDSEFGYFRADPIPTKEEVEQYYLEEFYSQNRGKFNNSTIETQTEQSEFFRSKFENYFTHCKKILGNMQGKKLFDIGFGFAQALLFFRSKEMEVSGIEPSSEGYEYAKRQGLNVSQGSIESTFSNVNQKYDVVTILNVLEHLRNPAEVLINVREKLLKPNGVLVIDVPNDFNDFQVVANNEFNLGEWWFYPPRHINYFSRSTLDNLLSMCGYNVKYVEGSFPLEMFLLFGDVYIGDNDLGKKCHTKRVHFETLLRKHNKEDKLSKFYQSLAELELGRDVLMFATPK